MSDKFEGFPKIARLSRECVITEKIDGTNAQVYIEVADGLNGAGERTTDGHGICVWDDKHSCMNALYAGSRTRIITPEQDNYGFASWAFEHAQELADGLGEGRHFGEWWGQGIQRKYGMKEKRFSLFNTGRWTKYPDQATEKRILCPECCDVVPVLFAGPFTTAAVNETLHMLDTEGSQASPGFKPAEGIVIYHVKAGVYFKKTIMKDEEPKGRNTP